MNTRTFTRSLKARFVAVALLLVIALGVCRANRYRLDYAHHWHHERRDGNLIANPWLPFHFHS